MMQTFLPSPDFTGCARFLDNRRLNKQIVEVDQILSALDDPDSGWRNHPAVKMWHGHYAALVSYGTAMYYEWQARLDHGERGGKREHKSGERIWRRYCDLARAMDGRYKLPAWLGTPELHRSHRACLLAKDPEHYGQFGWSEDPTPQRSDGSWPYYWPVS